MDPSLLAQADATASQEPKIHVFTSSVTLTSDYRYRGLTQTMQRPAIQGSFDYTYRGGLYLGAAGSNVSTIVYPKAVLEMDFYGGYRFTRGPLSFDLGGIYVFYPSSNVLLLNPQTGKSKRSKPIANFDLNASAAWKWLTLKYSHSTTDFYGAPDTSNTGYLDLTATKTFQGGWGLAAHYGHQWMRNWKDAAYDDWRLGVFKDIKGFVLGLDYIDTNAKDAVYLYSDDDRSMNIGKAGAVVYLKRSF